MGGGTVYKSPKITHKHKKHICNVIFLVLLHQYTPLLNPPLKALCLFNEEIKRIFDKHAPIKVKKVRGKPCEWLSRDLKKVMIYRDRVLRKARRTKRKKLTSLGIDSIKVDYNTSKEVKLNIA